MFPLYINLIALEGEKVLVYMMCLVCFKSSGDFFHLITGDWSNLYSILHVLMISQG